METLAYVWQPPVWKRLGSVFSPTVANAFFKPTTCGDVGGHASWSTNCFKRSLSDVMELRVDFMVVYTEERKNALLNNDGRDVERRLALINLPATEYCFVPHSHALVLESEQHRW